MLGDRGGWNKVEPRNIWVTVTKIIKLVEVTRAVITTITVIRIFTDVKMTRAGHY